MDLNSGKFRDKFGNVRGPKNLWERLISPLKLDTPYALTMEGWEEWESKTKKKHPLLYWLNNTLPHLTTVHFTFKFNKIVDWIRYRTIDRYHILKINSLKPRYYDPDTILLHAAFQVLVDHVEIGIANKNIDYFEKNKVKKSKRCPEAGLDYLEWEINNAQGANQSQIDHAKEVKELYSWWINRKYRVEPYSYKGIWEEYDKLKDELLKTDPNAKAFKTETFRIACEKAERLEAFYTEEDTNMLIRLCKIRDGLWS